MEEKEQNLGVQNPAHVLAKKLQENRRSLHIGRIQDKTKEAFLILADEEFCGDYGMTLKWLMDDIPSQDTRMVVAKLEEQEARLQALEAVIPSSKESSSEDTIKMLDGKTKIGRVKK